MKPYEWNAALDSSAPFDSEKKKLQSTLIHQKFEKKGEKHRL